MPNIINYQTGLANTYIEPPIARPTLDGSETLLGEFGNTTISFPLASAKQPYSVGYYQLTETTLQSGIHSAVDASGTVTFYLPPANIKLSGTFHSGAGKQLILVPYGDDTVHEGSGGQGMIIASRCLFTISTLDYGEWDIILSGPSPTISYGSFTYGFGV